MKRQPIRYPTRGLEPGTKPRSRKVTTTYVEPTASPGQVVFTFGRHKGESISAVFDADPTYIDWMSRQHKVPLQDRSTDPHFLRLSRECDRFKQVKGE